MVARTLYVVHMIAALMGCTAILSGAIHGNLNGWICGCAALWLSYSCRFFLRRNRQFAGCERSLNDWGNFGEAAFAEGSPGAAEFEALLERRDELELRRGTAAFDPWEMLALQHQIDECVRRYPELEPLLELRDI